MTGQDGGEAKPLVGVVMGSDSDLPVMREACRALEEFGVPYEVRILSAHRSPEETAAYAKGASGRGVKALIAGAGWAAHLAGVLASQTTLPIIGVPIDSSPLKGFDALLSTVQMPPGIPVATMAVGKGGARNAALFAVQILALGDEGLAGKLLEFKEKMAVAIREKNRAFQESPDERAPGG
jgi:phosphoribosylaminoimidazole carboxylase PurE protein